MGWIWKPYRESAILPSTGTGSKSVSHEKLSTVSKQLNCKEEASNCKQKNCIRLSRLEGMRDRQDDNPDEIGKV